MIVLDTHAWIWWVENSSRLSQPAQTRINSDSDVRVCAISSLEIAIAVSRNRLILRLPVDQWLGIAQTVVQVDALTSDLCIASTSLPGTFHRDPADRLIVALARQLNCELITADRKILAYSDVRAIPAE